MSRCRFFGCGGSTEGAIAGSEHSKLISSFNTEEIPTLVAQNAFSQRLAHLNFDLYAMLVVDLMHDFEIGGWKSFFIHLLRILESQNPVHLCAEMDRR
jgi:hypothetical protein